MQVFFSLLSREVLAYIRTPIAMIYIVLFHLTSLGICFFIGKILDGGQVSMSLYFQQMPWVLVLFVPATSMSLWANEWEHGTIEILSGLPTSWVTVILAKYLASLTLILGSIFLSISLPLTLEYLGDPNWGSILSGYIGVSLLAGSFLAINMVLSALTRNANLTFIIGACLCFFLICLGWNIFNELLSQFIPRGLTGALSSLGIMPHYEAFVLGVIDSRHLSYFLTLIGFCMVLNYYLLPPRYGK